MGLIHTFVEVTGEKTRREAFWLPTSSIGFKAYARDFESYLKFLRNLENKISTSAEIRYFYFSNYLKNDKECWKSWHVLLTSTKSCLTAKNEIHSRCLLDLKLVKSLICADKRPDFFIKINVSLKKCDFEFFPFLLSYRIGFKLQLHVFF